MNPKDHYLGVSLHRVLHQCHDGAIRHRQGGLPGHLVKATCCAKNTLVQWKWARVV